MYPEIVLYACAVSAGLFSHRYSMKQNYTVRTHAPLNWRTIKEGLEEELFPSRIIRIAEQIIEDKEKWYQNSVYQFLLKIGKRHLHENIPVGFLDDVEQVPEGQFWWLTDPTMANRRKFVKQLKADERTGSVQALNYGYFDFEPGLEIKLYSKREMSDSCEMCAPVDDQIEEQIKRNEE